MTTGTTTAHATDTRPFAPFEWMLASRYLRARRKEGFISVIAGFSFVGIMLGVATLIIVMAVMNGFRHQLFEKILGLNGHAVVYKHHDKGPFEEFADVVKKIEAVPGVTKAIPLVEGQVLYSSPVQALGGFVRGMTEDGVKGLELVAKNVIHGTLDGFDSQDGVAVGSRLAQSLGLKHGDAIFIINPRGSTSPFGVVPRQRSYRIQAIFEMGMSEYDRTMVFMPMKMAQSFLSRGDGVDVIEVMATSPEGINDTIAAMKGAVGPDYGFTSWRQRNMTFFTVLEVERMVMFIILSLIILVAALNIISGMMMLVKDKSRDIAVLRTMGATKGAMMRVFLITGASIGVVGTIAGFVLGVLFCWRINDIKDFLQWVTGTTIMDPTVYYLTRLPVLIDPRETIGIVLMAIVLTLIATIYPSWRASKLDPVEVLRYE
jgi:lipoprotein-releasing system permease protein